MIMSALSSFIDARLKQAVSDSTFKKRKAFLMRIGNGFDDFSFLNNFDAILRMLESYPNIDTRWNLLMHVIVAIKSSPELIEPDVVTKYDALVSNLKEARIAKADNNIKSEKQIKSLDNTLKHWQDILRDSFNKLLAEYNIQTNKASISPRTKKALKEDKAKLFTFAKKLQDRIIMACYLIQPAIRSNFSTMLYSSNINKTNNSDNWMVLSKANNCMLLNHFKNSNKFHSQRIELTIEFQFYMKIWIDTLKLIQKSPKFVLHYSIEKLNHKISAINNDNSFTNLVPQVAERILNKRLTINDFRHLWEIAIQRSEEYAIMTISEKNAMHEQLLHSRNTAEYYNVV